MVFPNVFTTLTICKTPSGYIPVKVEVGLRPGLPQFSVLGLASPATKESRERIRMAIESSGFQFPFCGIVVNLSPSQLGKQLSFLDLPIAIGILSASGQIPPREGMMALGSFQLQGRLEAELEILSALWGFPSTDLPILVPALLRSHTLPPGKYLFLEKLSDIANPEDLSEIPEVPLPPASSPSLPQIQLTPSQCFGLQGLLYGILGKLHCLLLGNPGTGKTFLAGLAANLQPPWEEEEWKAELSLRFQNTPYISLQDLPKERPFRSPHHTITEKGLVGGGSPLQMGEISLASGGILFLDEISECKESTLEALREPMQERSIFLSRVREKKEQRANFLLFGAMNPCPCGNWGGKKPCSCSERTIRSFQRKISGPFLDRMGVEIVLWENGENRNVTVNLEEMRKKLNSSYEFQKNRNTKEKEAVEPLEGYSIRKSKGILRLARAIADWNLSLEVSEEHISEALMYQEISKMQSFIFG